MKANYNTEIAAAKLKVEAAQIAFNNNPSQKTAKTLTEEKIELDFYISRVCKDDYKKLGQEINDTLDLSK